MKNVTVAVKGNILTITIDLSKQVGPSKSGKTTIIATTAGNAPVPGTDAILGLNLYK
jgi:ABC-type cobalamin transport system ATPase subunit